MRSQRKQSPNTGACSGCLCLSRVVAVGHSCIESLWPLFQPLLRMNSNSTPLYPPHGPIILKHPNFETVMMKLQVQLSQNRTSKTCKKHSLPSSSRPCYRTHASYLMTSNADVLTLAQNSEADVSVVDKLPGSPGIGKPRSEPTP